ncbi:MAG: hypothetical protein WD944_03160 [Steroidobacteraceae bacterium]
MWHAAHVELVRQVVKSVLVLEDEREFPHQFRVLEIPGQILIRLGHEQPVVSRKRRVERGCDREIVLGAVAGAAGAAIAAESFVEEDVFAFQDERVLRRRSGGRPAGR